MNWAGSVAFLALGIATVVYTTVYDQRRRRKPRSNNAVELRFVYQTPLLYLMGSAFIIIGLLGLFGIS